MCDADGATRADAAADPLLGTEVGSFRIARRIGAGGMGRVYLAVHPTIGSRVAIKVLTSEAASDPDLVERFFAEARAVNLIRHDGIVDIIDLGTLPDRRPYIIMEYLRGASLGAVIAEHGALPLGTLARLVEEVLDALGAAHRKRIVHRDLKPDNIFVLASGRAKVLDFGIAKLEPELAGGRPATRTNQVLGTPGYMAPEQVSAGLVDARADLYAIGVILFEAATGQRPFTASGLYELFRQHIEAVPPRPSAVRADLPAAYEATILRALAKAPSARHATAAELARALHAAAADLPPEAFAELAPAGDSVRMEAASSDEALARTIRLADAVQVDSEPRARTVTEPRDGIRTRSERPAATTRRRVVPAIVAGAAVAAAAGWLAVRGSSPAAPVVAAPVDANRRGSNAVAPADLARPGELARSPHAALDPFDPIAYAPTARTFARKDFAADADLVMLSANADASGTIDLGQGAGYVFRSPSKGACVFASITRDADYLYPYDATGCPVPTVPLPTCTLAGLWSRARSAGADGIALRLTYLGTWTLTGGHFTTQFGDRCTDTVAPAPDLARFDASAFMPAARKLARGEMPDAELTSFYVDGVAPDGQTKLAPYAGAQYQFRSAARSQPDADHPEGSRLDCVIIVSATATGVRADHAPPTACNAPTLAAPRCTLAQVWTRQRAHNADGVALIRFDGTWHFWIGNTAYPDVPDDC